MVGAQQREPVPHRNHHVTALLAERYAQYLHHRVSLDEIARYLRPDEPTDKQRNLAAKIGRFFRNGSGAASERWSYLQSEILLGFPSAERPDRILACAALYRRAFPDATDCPYSGTETKDESLADYARRNVEDSLRLLGQLATPEDLSDDDVRFVADRLVPLLDVGSLFNPCRRLASFLRAQAREPLSPQELQAITQCDTHIAQVDRELAAAGSPHLVAGLRGYIFDHRSEHRQMLAPAGGPTTPPATGVETPTALASPDGPPRSAPTDAAPTDAAPTDGPGDPPAAPGRRLRTSPPRARSKDLPPAATDLHGAAAAHLRQAPDDTAPPGTGLPSRDAEPSA